MGMKITSPYLRNLFFAVDEIRTNPLVHIFMYITFAFGICFAFLADPSGASSTFLYKLTMANLGHGWVTNLWGLAAIGAAVTNIIAYILRRKWLGLTASYWGFAVWVFAFIIYMSGGFWFGALVGSLPNIMFWVWQYVAVAQYHKLYEPGLYPVLRTDTID